MERLSALRVGCHGSGECQYRLLKLVTMLPYRGTFSFRFNLLAKNTELVLSAVQAASLTTSTQAVVSTHVVTSWMCDIHRAPHLIWRVSYLQRRDQEMVS